jgi:hypothetical protein
MAHDFRFIEAPPQLTLSVRSQFYKYHFFSLAQTWVHSYAITSRTKQAVYTNFQLWIDKTATFNLTPSGKTSDLTFTVSCVLNRPSWPYLAILRGVVSRNGWKTNVLLIWALQGVRLIVVGDLCNHVGFTDVAAPRGCWRLLEQQKSPDSQPIFERKLCKNWPTLSKI